LAVAPHTLLARPFLVALFLALPTLVAAQSHEAAAAAHADPVAPVVLALAIILAAAKLGGHLAARLGQPAVLGELVTGVTLGSFDLAGFDWFRGIEADATIEVLARIGVVILLFEVGLESTVPAMLKVGRTAVLVALLGVLAPFALGWGVGAWMLPDKSPYVHAFLGATLTATSVGITARVLQDLRRSQSPEARVILGAAVIDDVLGLIILAVVAGAIGAADQGGSASYGEIALMVGKAVVFLFGALIIGVYVSPRVFGLASHLSGQGVLLVTALVFCFVLAYLSSIIGLAPIVGAYAAGLILEDAHFRPFADRGERQLEHLVHPLSTFLVPVFFVVMGMRVDVTAFLRVDVLGLAALLTLAAMIGKQACAFAVIGPRIDRLSVAIGMMPRGEVGLIFANVGVGLSLAGQPIIDQGIFSAVVIMAIVTTMTTPPLLKWSLARRF
jgi:Kef-type K+ transport system membrane component KefB